MADMEATIKLTADMSKVEAELSALIKQFEKLSGEHLPKTAKALKDVENASNNAAEGHKKHKQEAEGLSGAVEKLGKHSLVVNNLLRMMGLEGLEAAEKMKAASEVMEGFGKAVPALMAIAAAVTIVAAGFNLFKEGITAAGALAGEMVKLEVVTKNNGQSWSQASSKVNEYLENLEKTTAFTGKDAVQAFEKLAIAGKSTGDSQSYVNVAQGLAVATGSSLTDATQLLIKASEGHARALVSLGILKKDDIKDGMTQEQLLKKVYDRTKDVAAAYANTLPGALEQTHAAFEAFLEAVGKPFQDIMVTNQKYITAFIREATQGLKDMVKAAQKWAQDNKQFVSEVMAIFNALGVVVRVALDIVIATFKLVVNDIQTMLNIFADIFTGNWKKLWTDVKTGMGNELNIIEKSFGNFGENLITIAKHIVENIGPTLSHAFKAMAMAAQGNFAGASVEIGMGVVDLKLPTMKGNNLGGDGFAGLFDFNKGKVEGPGKLDDNSEVPGEKKTKEKKAKKPKVDHTIAAAEALRDVNFDDVVKDMQAEDSAMAKLGSQADNISKQLRHFSEAQKSADEAVKLSLSNQDYQTKSREAAELKTKNLAATVDLYQKAESKANSEVLIAKTTQDHLRDAHVMAIVTLNNYIDKVKASGHETKQNAEHIKDLRAKVGEAKRADDEHIVVLDKKTTALEKLRIATDKAKIAVGENTDKVREAIAAESRAADTFYTKEKVRVAEDNALAGASAAKKYQYYFDLYAAQEKLAEEYKANNDIRYVDEEKLAVETYAKMEAAHKAMVDQQTAQITKYLDMVIIQHKSMKDVLKSIYDDILKQFIAMVAKMITESILFKNVTSNLGGGGGGGGGGGLLSFFTSIFHHGGGGGGGGPTTNWFEDNAKKAASGGGGGGLDLSPSTISKITGSPNGVSPFQSMSNFLGRGISGPGSATYGSIGLGVVGGGLIGSAIGGLMNNGQNYGMQGGAIGGGLGAAFGASALAGLGVHIGAFAGPVGALAGAVLGSVLGSLFGSHDKPENMPDKYDTTRYVGIISNLLGHAGANGVEQDQDPTLKTLFNGKTGIAAVETTLAQYGSKDKAPDWLKPMFDELKGLYGISATGSGKLNFGHAINNENITGASGVDGKIHQYTEYGAALAKFAQAYSQNPPATAAAIAQIFQVDRMAPDFNNARVSNFHGGDGGIHSVPGGTNAPPFSISGPRAFGGLGAFAGPIMHGVIGQPGPGGSGADNGKISRIFGGGTGSGANFHNNNGIHPITINVQNLVGTDGMTQLAERLSIIRTQNSFHGRFNRNQDEY